MTPSSRCAGPAESGARFGSRAAVFVLAALAAVVPLRAQEIDGPIFAAMIAEMERATQHLVIEQMPAPYFLSYRIQDSEVLIIEARYGALVQSEQFHDRYLYTDLRVGSPDLDNSGFVGTWRDVYRRRLDLPVEDDYASLRHHLWLETDSAYKNALENLARKKAYLQAHPVKEEIPDLVPADCVVHIEEPAQMPDDGSAWEARVRSAAQVLRAYPRLQDWKVTYVAALTNVRYVNSEGGRHLKGGAFQFLEVAATSQADDGQRLSHGLHWVVRDGDPLPQGEDLRAAVQTMARELEAMVTAPTLDEYAGPVLFSGYAAAQFISQLFVHQLTPVRKPLTAEDWMEQYLPAGKLARRLSRRIMPRMVTITDEPGRESWRGRRCAGTQAVDDEGVASQELTLVKEGRLITLPMTRQPTKKLRASNGHAQTLQNQWTMAGLTNVIVKPSETKKDMLKELRRLCREADMEFGLWITHLEDPDVAQAYRWTESGGEEEELLTAPVVVHRVYAEDGRTEPVRGLVFDEVSVRVLRDIAAMGNDPILTNLRQPSGFEGMRYPLAIVTPSILVEEMEFKEGSVREPVPLSANPLFAD